MYVGHVGDNVMDNGRLTTHFSLRLVTFFEYTAQELRLLVFTETC